LFPQRGPAAEGDGQLAFLLFRTPRASLRSLKTQDLRLAVLRQFRFWPFFPLGRVSRLRRCLDHVVPLARGGGNSYRNLVSCCTECNARKGEMAAKDFLRWLYREQRFSGAELNARLRAVDGLAADKLRSVLPTVQLRRSGFRGS
jgi:HNH endonuclease